MGGKGGEEGKVREEGKTDSMGELEKWMTRKEEGKGDGVGRTKGEADVGGKRAGNRGRN